MRPARWVSLLVVVLTCVVSAAVEPSYVEGQMLVRFASTTSADEANRALGAPYEVVRALVPSMNLYLVRLKQGLKVKDALSRLNRLDSVAYAQADHQVTLRAIQPDDGDFSRQWGMLNTVKPGADISATQAWEMGTGGKDRDGNDIVVAVVDGGVDLDHPDLKDNLWVNTGEVAGNGVDDDGNGYIDDVNGWNAYDNNGRIPANAHGTHVAGITGASGNNGKHVAGVNWKVKIMAVAGSSSATSTVAAGYGYVLAQKKLWIESGGRKGANVVVTNSSFGVDFKHCTDGDFPVWNDLYEEMGKAGILSAAATANQNVDVDTKGDIPTSCSSEYIIKVTNTDKSDKRYTGAAYGRRSVELGAPGTSVVSTLPGDRVGALTGTSMATPHVAGAVALMHSLASPDFARVSSRSPSEGARQLKKILLSTVDPIPALADITVTGGRLNLAAAVEGISRFQSR